MQALKHILWWAPFDGHLTGTGAVDANAQHADVLALLEHEHGAALTALTSGYRPRLNGGDTHLVPGEPAATLLEQARTEVGVDAAGAEDEAGGIWLQFQLIARPQA